MKQFGKLKGPGTDPQSSKLFQRFLKIIALVCIYHLTKFGGLTLNVLSISESYCIEIKINLKFCFHTSFWSLKRIYQRLHKTFQGTTKKCFSSSGIGTFCTNFHHGITDSVDHGMIKGHLRHKTVFCHKITLYVIIELFYLMKK